MDKGYQGREKYRNRGDMSDERTEGKLVKNGCYLGFSVEGIIFTPAVV